MSAPDRNPAPWAGAALRAAHGYEVVYPAGEEGLVLELPEPRSAASS